MSTTSLAIALAIALIAVVATALFLRRRWLKQLATQRPQQRYCPNCRCKLKERQIGGKKKLACPRCQYVFWNNPLVVAVGIVPSTDGKGVLLGKRSIPPGLGDYGLLGGFLEPGEGPEQGVVREAFEESGLKVEVVRLLWIIALPKINQILIFYICKAVGGTLTVSDETSEVAYFPCDHLPTNIAFLTHQQAIDMYLQQRDKTGAK